MYGAVVFEGGFFTGEDFDILANSISISAR